MQHINQNKLAAQFLSITLLNTLLKKYICCLKLLLLLASVSFLNKFDKRNIKVERQKIRG